MGGCAWRGAAGRRLRRYSLPATFPGVPGGRVGRGTLEAAELSGKCRSRCCGAAPGVRRRWEPRLGRSRVAWGLPLRSERSEKREAGKGDGNRGVFREAVASGPPQHLQSAAWFPAYPAGCGRARVVAGRWEVGVPQRSPRRARLPAASRGLRSLGRSRLPRRCFLAALL